MAFLSMISEVPNDLNERHQEGDHRHEYSTSSPFLYIPPRQALNRTLHRASPKSSPKSTPRVFPKVAPKIASKDTFLNTPRGTPGVTPRIPSETPHDGRRKPLSKILDRMFTKKFVNPCKSSFNPETLTDQKRLWEMDRKNISKQDEKREATKLFEHFVVVGLPPSTDTKSIESDYASRKEAKNSDILGLRPAIFKDKVIDLPTLQPQILFKYPPNKKMTMEDLPGFCFPNGVKARVVERTPSLSDLNKVLYGLEHRKSDEKSFIFLLKVSDNVTMYGVCLLVDEIIQQPPGILASRNSSLPFNLPLTRYLVSAPRCYCILTKLPFFDLHFQFLNSIVSQERLDRIKNQMMENSFSSQASAILSNENKFKDRDEKWSNNSTLVSSSHEPAIAHNSGAFFKSNSQRIKSINRNRFAYNSKTEESLTIDESSLNISHPKVLAKSTSTDDYMFHRAINMESPSRKFDRLRSSKSWDKLSLESEEEYNTDSFKNDYGASVVRTWAEKHENNPLLTLCDYYNLSIPNRGEQLVFQPPSLHSPLTFVRPCLPSHLSASANDFFVKAKLVELEEVMGLSTWTIPALCRSLSLENILSLIVCALLERQIVVICPNLGMLTAVVLALIPLIRPFSWQSLILPILPSEMSCFIDAPVPFIVGIPEKLEELDSKSSYISIVNVATNKILNPCNTSFPYQAQLLKKLRPVYSRLSQETDAHCRPVYQSTVDEVEDAETFLRITSAHLKSFCSNLQLHALTDVKPGGVRTALLLKESFIESFQAKDQPFIKTFADTQLFSTYSDVILSSTEFNIEDVPL